MRRLTALALGLILLLSGPAAAQQGQSYDIRAELLYTPLRVQSTGSTRVNGDLPALTLRAEGRVYQAIILGGEVTRAVSGGLDVGNQTFDSPEFLDFKIDVKVPFNIGDFIEAERVRGPRPAFSPFYAYVGYKDTTLSAINPLTRDRRNIESAGGPGFGLGTDIYLEPVSLFGQFAYYPTLFVSENQFLRVYEADAGLRTSFSEDRRLQLRLGYHWEKHDASNLSLIYDGIRLGASAEF